MAVVVVAVAARHLGARARRAHEPLRLLVAHARRQVRQREVEPDAHAGAAADDRGLCLHRRLGAEHLLDADVCRELVRRRRRVEGVLQEQAQRELGGERLRRARDLVQLGGGGEVRGHVDPLGLGAHRVPHAVVAALAARVRVRRVAARRHAGVSLVPAVDLVGLAHRRLEAPAGARWRGRGVSESGAPKCAQVRRIAPKCAELRRIARRTRRRPRRRRPACSRGRESSATAAGCGPTTSRRRRCGRAVGFRPSRAGVAPASAAAARGDSGRAAARRRRGRAAASCRPARGAARGTCRAGAPPASAASAGGAAAARGRPWSGRGRPRGSPALGRPGARGWRRWEGGGGVGACGACGACGVPGSVRPGALAHMRAHLAHRELAVIVELARPSRRIALSGAEPRAVEPAPLAALLALDPARNTAKRRRRRRRRRAAVAVARAARAVVDVGGGGRRRRRRAADSRKLFRVDVRRLLRRREAAEEAALAVVRDDRLPVPRPRRLVDALEGRERHTAVRIIAQNCAE